jgi:hypothetical protein
VAGLLRFNWVVAGLEAAAEGESCAVADWLLITKHATIANRISEVSTLSRTPMVPSDVELTVL